MTIVLPVVMSELHNEDESLLALLYRHNLGLVIENIVEHVGHTATVNMLCTCKSWLAILSDIVPLRRLLFLRYVRQRNFAKLCDLNRWSVAMSLRECERPVEKEQEQQQMHPIKRLAYINYTTTDLRRTINRYGIRTLRVKFRNSPPICWKLRKIFSYFRLRFEYYSTHYTAT